jgi:hypothetical protein
MKRLVALGAGLVLAWQAHALVVNVGRLLKNPDGSYSTAYRNGDKGPSSAELTCDISGAPQLLNLQTGTPYSENQNQWFSGSDEGTTETYAVVTISGDDVEDAGFTMDGTTLEWDAVLTGSGVLQVQATIMGQVVACGSRQWSAIAPPAGDTMAPTGVTGITTAEGPGEGEFTISFDQSDDPRDDDALPGGGVASYLVTHAGGTTSITSGVQAGYSPNWRAAPVEVNDFSPNPSSSQSGRQLTLVAAGAGMNGSLDEFYFLPVAVTGGFRLTAKLNSMVDEANTFANMGLTVSGANPAAGGADLQPRVSTYWQDDGPGFSANFETKTRLSAGAGAWASAVSSAIAAPDGYCIQIARAPSSNVFETFISADCITWSPLASPTVSMPDTVYVGPHTTAVSTTPVTAVFDWVSLQAYERLSATITAASGNLTVTAIDADDNDEVSASVAYTSLAPAATIAKKHRPGHYWGLMRGDTAGTNAVSTVTSRCNAIADEDEIEGISIRWNWSKMETGSTVETATYTWTELDAIVAACKAVGKSVWIDVIDRTFSSPSNLSACPVPAYIRSRCVANTQGVMPPLWESDVMDRAIALFQQICMRYDDEWYVIGVSDMETAASNPVSGSGYTAAALVTQLIRFYAEVSPVCQKTVYAAGQNFLSSGTNAQIAQLHAALYAPNAVNMAVTGPDACTTNPNCPTEADAGTTAYGTTPSQDVYLGVLGAGGVPQLDRRGMLLAAWQSQGAGVDDKTFAQMYAYQYNILQQHMMFWENNDWCNGGSNCGRNMEWTDDVLPELRTGNYPTHTDCPTAWTVPCDTTP